ncbi:hypothetical protein GEMRC1_009353 [Eukaryota sp. GEM-RC1]
MQVNANSVFHLDQSDIVLSDLNITSVSSKDFVCGNLSTIFLSLIEIDQSISNVWFSLVNCLFHLNNLNFSSTHGDAFSVVNSTDSSSSMVLVVNSNFSIFLNALNSELSINSLSFSTAQEVY